MIHRNKSIWAVVLAFVLIAAVAIPITVGAQIGGNEEPLTQDAELYASLWGISPEEAQDAISHVADGEVALMRDAKFYASDWGIDIDEAVERLKLQEPIGELNAALELDEQDTFGGLYIQHSPVYRAIANFTKNGDETILRYVDDGPLTGIVEVRTVAASLAELRARQRAVDATVGNMGIASASGINVRDNTIELYVTDPEALNGAFKREGAILPDLVRVVEVESLGADDSYIFGGLALSTCTSGFSVRTSAGVKGVCTAGHCSNTQAYSGTNLPYQSGLDSGTCDAQWHTTSGYTPINWIYDGYATRSITATKSWYNQTIGEFVAKYGKTTGYTWGYIEVKDYRPQPEHTYTWVIVDNPYGQNLSSAGDSGGPWFSGNTAYGIHTGGTGDIAWYMPINFIEILGVTVMTSP